MLGIATHQLLAQPRVVLGPEAGEILRDLHRALVRREQVENERDATVADGGRTREAEEVLHPRRDPRRLLELVVDRHAAAARQLEVRRREPGDERAMLAEAGVEELEHPELAQLVE